MSQKNQALEARTEEVHDRNQPFLKQLTIRGLIIGSIGSVIITTSSIYIALRMGSLPWPTVFVAILSMAVLKAFGKTNVNEINVTHTTMSAGAMVAGGLAFTIPGIWILNPSDTTGYGIVALIAFSGTVLGLIFTILLRYHFIVSQNLAYPIGTAAAETVKAGGEKNKAKYLFSALGLSFLFTVLRDGLAWIPAMWKSAALAAHHMTFGLRISPMAIGIGYIIGPVYTGVWFLGAVLSYLIIMPLGLAQGWFADAGAAEDFKNSLGIGLMVGTGIGIIIKNIIPQAKKIYGPMLTGKLSADNVNMKWAPLAFAIIAFLLTLFTNMSLIPSILTVVGVWLATAMSATITGQTGINPMDSFAIIILLSIKALANTEGNELFLVAAVIAVACGLTGDILNDFKSGHILKTNPKAQFVAEAVGGLIGAFTAAIVLFIMLSAFGGIGPGTELPAPQAFATSSMISGIPHITAFWIGLVIGVILYVLNVPGMTLGLGVYLPVFISTTAFIGGFISIIVKKVLKADKGDKGLIIASGLLGGEGVAGVTIALVKVVSGG